MALFIFIIIIIKFLILRYELLSLRFNSCSNLFLKQVKDYFRLGGKLKLKAFLLLVTNGLIFGELAS